MELSQRMLTIIYAAVFALVIALLTVVDEEDKDLEGKIVIAGVIIVVVGSAALYYYRPANRFRKREGAKRGLSSVDARVKGLDLWHA